MRGNGTINKIGLYETLSEMLTHLFFIGPTHTLGGSQFAFVLVCFCAPELWPFT